jgi:ABC-type dipeptide/oligopeptide/nickel transport system permease subunit
MERWITRCFSVAVATLILSNTLWAGLCDSDGDWTVLVGANVSALGVFFVGCILLLVDLWTPGPRKGGRKMNRWVWILLALGVLFLLGAASWYAAPDAFTPEANRDRQLGECMFVSCYAAPWELPPFGADSYGAPLLRVAMQGARIVTLPAIAAGLMVMFFATVAGLVRCFGVAWMDTTVQAFSELVGALPRLVVILVVAVILPREWRVLTPIAIAWALLASPSAMDEAAATAQRIGGTKFVEALKAHGFSAYRIYLYHVVWLNLRAVIVRQGAEVAMQVVFLEIALSYLAEAQQEPAFTHPEQVKSWATLLYQGYSALLGEPLYHSLALGLLLVALTAVMAQAVRMSARAR